MSVSANPGDSGGPVVNADGRVIGVTTLKAEMQEGIAFSVPVADLRAAVDAARKLTVDEERRLTEAHQARALFRNLMLFGALALAAADEVQVAQQAQKLIPGAPDPGRGNRADWLKKLKEEGFESLEQEARILENLKNSATISPRTRQELQEMLDTDQDLLRRLSGPNGGMEGMMGFNPQPAGPGMMAGQPGAEAVPLSELRKRLGERIKGLALEFKTEPIPLPSLEPALVYSAIDRNRQGASLIYEVSARNVSDGHLAGIQAIIVVAAPNGGVTMTLRQLLPERLGPGATGRCIAKLGTFPPGTRVLVLFIDAEKQPIKARREVGG